MAGPAAGRLAVFGIDPHKATHTVVAVDTLGRQVAQRTVAARTPQHLELVAWLAPSPASRHPTAGERQHTHYAQRFKRDCASQPEHAAVVPTAGLGR